MTNGNDFKREVERLTFDLQQACQEKVQAAEYGLAVLGEKQLLQEKYDDLETEFEQVKCELSQSVEQISLLKSKNDVLAAKVEHKQGNIIQESSTRESAFATKVNDLQVELKNVKKSERSTHRENESLKQQIVELQKSYETLLDKKNQLGKEVKDRKLRESQFNDEYNLLEEENTCLQKNLSKLKQTLVEYEGLKVENKSLLDEIDSLQLQLHVTSVTRDQFEKQLHEALDALKEQRERYAQYQKEIHELKQESIMKSWNIERSMSEFTENPIIRQITEELTNLEPVPASGMVDDLLKELQVTEMRELSEQLRVVNEEKLDLEKQLSRKNSSPRDMNSSTLSESTEYSDSEEGDEYTMNSRAKLLSDLKEANKQLRNRESVCQMDLKRLSEEIEELKKQLSEAEKERNARIESSKDESKALSEELLLVKSKLRDSQSAMKSFSADISMVKELNAEAQDALKSTQDELRNVYNDLVNLNASVSQDIVTGEKIAPHNPLVSSKDCFKLMTLVKEQVRKLQLAMGKQLTNTSNITPTHLSDLSKENLHLKEQLFKLQNIVATKREQISTLRTVLKANKSTYEVALANLKSRYENDKDSQAETNSQLKRQIKALKSECLTFTSMRSMFASRCDEYMKQLVEKEQVIKAAEEEKRTLNNLLKTAIQQKIAVKQKLEEFEIARERLRQFTKLSIKPSGKDSSKLLSSPTRPVTRV